MYTRDSRRSRVQSIEVLLKTLTLVAYAFEWPPPIRLPYMAEEFVPCTLGERRQNLNHVTWKNHPP